MQSLYPYLHILHLLFAIIFLGYLFFDVIIFSRLKNIFGDDFERVKMAITSRAIKIMPVCVLGLLITGGMMASTWIGSKAGGFFQTPLQQIFIVKILLAFIIFFGVGYSLFCKFTGKNTASFMKKHFHAIAFVVGFSIAVLAKIMFMV